MHLMQKITKLELEDSLKMLRETLCVAATAIGHVYPTSARTPEHIRRIQRCIDEIDRQRPLGSNGKHDNRHTKDCQCLDK
jgi:hypothetical protein